MPCALTGSWHCYCESGIIYTCVTRCANPAPEIVTAMLNTIWEEQDDTSPQMAFPVTVTLKPIERN